MPEPRNRPGRTMLAGDFARLLRRWNPRLGITCLLDRDTPATIWQRKAGLDYQEVCGIPKNFIPEYSWVDDTGHILKRGWRDCFAILIGGGYLKRTLVEQTLRCRLRMDGPQRV